MPLHSSPNSSVAGSRGEQCSPQAQPAPSVEQRLHDIHVRPIRPDDWRRLQRFHTRLSEHTVALRFHGAKKYLSVPLAYRLTHVDGHDNAAWVATTGSRGRIIGVARYFRLTPSCAEVAFVIEDGYQHHGVGSRLMKRLVQTARENGITEFIAEVLPGNLPMVHLLEEAGRVETHLDCGVYEIRVALREA